MNSDSKNKEQYIKLLKEEAEQVKKIIGVYRKRRPVVIEFSGMPKSGKTTSINSLMQFLKRNDFKVKVILESASICPVKDKHGPMFNIWTACDSIRALVGELESDRTQYDVIICDRGIFDSMCWFQWLLNNDKMEQKMKDILDRFLSMRELISFIDIVFVYKARPEVSIDREYASLLTDIPGSIMNKDVLEGYLKAVEDTEEKARTKKLFRELHSIDTSDKNQNEVGKEVTETTLRIIRELLEERIGYIDMPEQIIQQFESKHWLSYDSFKKNGGLSNPILFKKRSDLEKDFGFVQIVPIAVLKDISSKRVLMVKKLPKATGDESPEKDKDLPYVGGHVRYEDVIGDNCNDFVEICKTALKREIREELGISVSLDRIIPDFIYVRDGSRSNLHMAVCFLIEEKEETLKLRMDSEELRKNRGAGKSGTFVMPESIADSGNSWSKVILNKYFGIIPQQRSLFDEKE